MTKTLKTLLGFLPALVSKVVGKLGLSAAVSQVVQNVIIVFVTSFVGAVVSTHLANISLPAVVSLLGSAGAAGVTGAVHYLTGLVPASPSNAAAALSKTQHPSAS